MRIVRLLEDYIVDVFTDQAQTQKTLYRCNLLLEVNFSKGRLGLSQGALRQELYPLNFFWLAEAGRCPNRSATGRTIRFCISVRERSDSWVAEKHLWIDNP